VHSDESKDLIIKLLEKDQNKRISLDEALAHDWFKEFHSNRFDEGI
jgi:serine/threonine protein kinase